MRHIRVEGVGQWMQDQVKARLKVSVMEISQYCRNPNARLTNEELEIELHNFFTLQKEWRRRNIPAKAPDLEWYEVELPTLIEERVENVFRKLLEKGYRFNQAEFNKFSRLREIHRNVKAGANKKPTRRRK